MASQHVPRLQDCNRDAARRKIRREFLFVSVTALCWPTAGCSPELMDPDVQSNPYLQRIDVSPTSATLEVGGELQLSALAFDQHGNDLTYGNLDFRWSSTHAQYVEVDPTGQTVTVRALQEYVNAGATGWTDVEVRIQGRSQPVGRARIMVSPVDNIQVTPSPISLEVGESLPITADATTSTGAVVTVPTTWSVDDGTVASVGGAAASNAATITALAPGTTTLRAIAGTKESGPVTVTVAEAPPEPGSLAGVVTDENGTGVEGLVVRIGGPTPQRTATDADGRYSAMDLTAGAYTVYVQGVDGLRFLSTEVHEVGVQAGATTMEDITTTEGNFLQVLDGSGDRQAEAGSTVSAGLDLRVWNRSGCPLCAPALIVGIDGDPVVLHPLGTPGPMPGVQTAATLSFTTPSQPGDYQIYAMLVTGISTGTEEGREAARNAYRDRYGNGSSSGLWRETFIPIGALTVGSSETQDTYTRTPFVTVDLPVEIDFDLQGNLFVGSNALDSVRIVKVTPSGNPEPFGDKVVDPDALIVDKTGIFPDLGAGGVLVAGAEDAQYSNNHVTGIKANGSGNVVLIESAPPLLSNSSSLAFLSSGDLLVANYGNSTVSVLNRNGAGGFTLAPFYADPAGGDGLGSMVSVDGRVYVRTGPGAIVELDENADEITANLWPVAISRAPGALAVDVNGDLFGGDLLAAEAGPMGRIHRMDRETRTWSPVGDLVFDVPIYGLAVSPIDGALYVAERDGQIWKVTRNSGT